MGKILYKGLSKNELYPILFDLPLQTTQSTASQLHSASFGRLVQKTLWHQRFGYPSIEIVNRMLNKCSISSTPDVESSVCQACLQGKFHKLPFFEFISRSHSPFALAHSDVWGPSPYPFVGAFKYYVLFCDDFTKYTWILFFHSEIKVILFSCFQSLCAFVQNQFSTSIKTLRSDRGSEYVNHKFKKFLASKGMLYQISCPYNPE